MAMIPCPECQVPISKDAEDCPNCGYPMADFAERGLQPGGQEKATDLSGLLFIGLIALVGYGLWTGISSSKTQAALNVERAVVQGEKLHWDLLAAVNADPIYRRGALVDAWTDEPRASICVPIDGWNALPEPAKESLKRYTVSLVPVMRADPFGYIEDGAIAEGEAATVLLNQAATMNADDWCIYVGTPVAAEGTGGSMLRQGDEVASGAPRRSDR